MNKMSSTSEIQGIRSFLKSRRLVEGKSVSIDGSISSNVRELRFEEDSGNLIVEIELNRVGTLLLQLDKSEAKKISDFFRENFED